MNQGSTYFRELKEQIINQEKWDNQHFHVFIMRQAQGKVDKHVNTLEK
ncbi:hypothetical protein [Bacillus sp. V5-8f]|nr:hypothetical protein [Bacillus sp. V5-8f]